MYQALECYNGSLRGGDQHEYADPFFDNGAANYRGTEFEFPDAYHTERENRSLEKNRADDKLEVVYPDVVFDRDGRPEIPKQKHRSKNVDLIDHDLSVSDVNTIKNGVAVEKKQVRTINTAIIFVILAFLSLSLNFWTLLGGSVISDYFHGGQELTIGWLLFYACLFTFTLFVISQAVHIPLIGVANRQVDE